MSDAMQIRVGRPARGERMPTSCGECRRRKQKCNQGRPCSNCARRYPQPPCEYKAVKQGQNRPNGQPNFEISVLPPPFAEEPLFPLVEGVSEPLLPARTPSPLRSPWPSGDGTNSVRWSGVDIETPFPGSTYTGSPWENQWTSAPGSLAPTGLPMCDENCTLHSDTIHDAVKLLRARAALPAQYLSDQWHPQNTDEIVSWLRHGSAQPNTPSPRLVSNPLEDLAHLPIPATRQNAELLRIFVKLLSQFKASLDGKPDPNCQYIKYYVPFCIQTPLLAQVAIYTSACFLHETGYLDNMATMSHKGLAIRMLNEHLRSKSSTTDVAIAAVTQLILDEWYWGEANDLRAHLRGLREMIRLRGGFRNLGLDGMIAKLVITTDISIALSFEIPPFLQTGPEFEFKDTARNPLRLSLNTPLVSPLVPFSTCAESLRLHAATAQILDDMRFLISTVLALPANPSENELQKVHTTSAWIHERISSLPFQSPQARRQSVIPSDLLSPETAAGEVAFSRQNSPASATSPRISRRNSPLLQDGSQPDSSSENSYPHSQPQPILPGPQEPADVLYQAVRQAALIYSRVIMLRQSFRSVVTENEFLQLWTTMWRVPLATWKGVLGVFCWIVLGITPTARDTPHDRFVKSMLTISLNQMSIENWDIADAAMKSGLRLQRWLREGEAARAETTRDAVYEEEEEEEGDGFNADMSTIMENATESGRGKGKKIQVIFEQGETAMGEGSKESILPKWQ